jgi:hypothetical protein
VAEGEIRALRAKAVATEGAPRPPSAAPPPDPALLKKLDAALAAARAAEKERDGLLKRAVAAEERAARAAAAAAAAAAPPGSPPRRPASADEGSGLRRVAEAAVAASKRAEGTPTRKALAPASAVEAQALALAPVAASRVAALEKENKDLRAELEAFDLEFFEGARRGGCARAGPPRTPLTPHAPPSLTPHPRRDRGPQVPLRGGRKEMPRLRRVRGKVPPTARREPAAAGGRGAARPAGLHRLQRRHQRRRAQALNLRGGKRERDFGRV